MVGSANGILGRSTLLEQCIARLEGMGECDLDALPPFRRIRRSVTSCTAMDHEQDIVGLSLSDEVFYRWQVTVLHSLTPVFPCPQQ